MSKETTQFDDPMTDTSEGLPELYVKCPKCDGAGAVRDADGEEDNCTECEWMYVVRVPQTEQSTEERMQRCVNAVPTNWVDSILTGPDAVFDEEAGAHYNVERVLRAVKKRIEAIAAEEKQP